LPLIVPTVTSLARVIRNQAIREEYRAGKSLNELAEEYSLAYPWVIAILRGDDAPKPEPKPDNQPKLTF
jgi:Mor family transcriptional regulator